MVKSPQRPCSVGTMHESLTRVSTAFRQCYSTLPDPSHGVPGILETVQRRHRSLQAVKFVPTGQRARGQTLMILDSEVGANH
jgi:hypothetical protein